jgi:hypothetical protein
MTETELSLLHVRPPYTLNPSHAAHCNSDSDCDSKARPLRIFGVDVPRRSTVEFEVEVMLVNTQRVDMGLKNVNTQRVDMGLKNPPPLLREGKEERERPKDGSEDDHPLAFKQAGNFWFGKKMWAVARACYHRALACIEGGGKRAAAAAAGAAAAAAQIGTADATSLSLSCLQSSCLLNVAATYAKEGKHEAVEHYCNLADGLPVKKTPKL